MTIFVCLSLEFRYLGYKFLIYSIIKRFNLLEVLNASFLQLLGLLGRDYRFSIG